MPVSEKNLKQLYLSSLYLTPENTHVFWGIISIIYYCQEESLKIRCLNIYIYMWMA